MSYVDMGSQDYKTHNQLLEDIVIQSLKEAQVSFSNNSLLIIVWAAFFALSFVLMCLAVVFYNRSVPVEEQKEGKEHMKMSGGGHYYTHSLPCTKLESKDK